MGSVMMHMPRGGRISPESWRARHRIATFLLWAHVPALVLLGVLGPMPLWEAAVIPAGVAGTAALAALATAPRTKASITSVGLIACTFAAIELSGGEMAVHIHLYAVLIYVALYQQWAPLLWAVAIVVLHHGSLGLLNPQRVFGLHDMSHLAGLGQVALHAGLAALEVVGIVIFWHFAEQAEHEREAMREEADQQRQSVERAEQESRERTAGAERVRAEQAAEQAARLSAEALSIGGEARAAITAVAAVDAELTSLSAAVRDIAARSGEAAAGSTSMTGAGRPGNGDGPPAACAAGGPSRSWDSVVPGSEVVVHDVVPSCWPTADTCRDRRAG